MSDDTRGRDDSAQPSRRSFLVTLAGTALGVFVLPAAPGLAVDAKERILMTPPCSGNDGKVFVWIEWIKDDWKVMVWQPETEEEWAELRRFVQAAKQFNFEDPDTHSVKYEAALKGSTRRK